MGMLGVELVTLISRALALLTVLGGVGVAWRFHAPSLGRKSPLAAVPLPPSVAIGWPLVVVVGLFLPFIPALAPGTLYGSPVNLILSGGEALQLLGLGMYFGGVGLLYWTYKHLGRFMMPEIAIVKGHRLVTTGPYAHIRHPAYTSLLAMLLGLALLYLHPLPLLLFLLGLGMARWRAVREERLLSSPQAFGEEYKAYMTRTRRFLPRI